MAKKEKNACPRVDIGGQAVLDGVMMKAPDAIAVAVRRPDGDIVVKRDNYVSPAKKHKWMGLPFIRGTVNMVDMLKVGMNTLESSATMVGEEQVEEPSKFEKWLAAKLGKNVDKVVMGIAAILAVLLSLGLFVFLPNLAVKFIPNIPGVSADWMLVLKNLISGIVRIAILIAYIGLCGRIPEMRKTFQYHGSEHKTVYCNEHDLPLTPQNAQQFSTLHPRCGTSFLVLTFVLSILFFSVIDVLVKAVTGFDMGGSSITNFMLRIASRIVLLPCIMGIGYEVLKGLAHREGKWVDILRWPGMQMQRLTTKQPTDEMCEVAIISMNAALHGLPDGEKTEEGWVVLHQADIDRLIYGKEEKEEEQA